MNWIRKLIGQASSHWTHAGLTFVLTILAAGILRLGRTLLGHRR